MAHIHFLALVAILGGILIVTAYLSTDTWAAEAHGAAGMERRFRLPLTR